VTTKKKLGINTPLVTIEGSGMGKSRCFPHGGDSAEGLRDVQQKTTSMMVQNNRSLGKYAEIAEAVRRWASSK